MENTINVIGCLPGRRLNSTTSNALKERHRVKFFIAKRKTSRKNYARCTGSLVSTKDTLIQLKQTTNGNNKFAVYFNFHDGIINSSEAFTHQQIFQVGWVARSNGCICCRYAWDALLLSAQTQANLKGKEHTKNRCPNVSQSERLLAAKTSNATSFLGSP